MGSDLGIEGAVNGSLQLAFSRRDGLRGVLENHKKILECFAINAPRYDAAPKNRPLYA